MPCALCSFAWNDLGILEVERAAVKAGAPKEQQKRRMGRVTHAPSGRVERAVQPPNAGFSRMCARRALSPSSSAARPISCSTE